MHYVHHYDLQHVQWFKNGGFSLSEKRSSKKQMCWELMIDSNIVAVDVWTDSPYQTKVKFNG